MNLFGYHQGAACFLTIFGQVDPGVLGKDAGVSHLNADPGIHCCTEGIFSFNSWLKVLETRLKAFLKVFKSRFCALRRVRALFLMLARPRGLGGFQSLEVWFLSKPFLHEGWYWSSQLLGLPAAFWALLKSLLRLFWAESIEVVARIYHRGFAK